MFYKRHFLAASLIIFLASSNTLFALEDFQLQKVINHRPQAKQYVFDYAGLLRYSKENLEESLRFFKDKYKVEMVIVSVPRLGTQDISMAASNMFSKWNIGRDLSSRGILVFLSGQEKMIKVEVGFGAEGAFTDLFCGYIERKQLKPYFENNQVDFGLAATMEEFIRRAEGKLTDKELNEKMQGLLSGGAGIKKEVKVGESKGKAISQEPGYPAQPTPEALLGEWLEELKSCGGASAFSTMYTEESRMLWHYSPAMSKELCQDMYNRYSRPHEIKEQGDYVVVLFSGATKEGPIFMKKSPLGWQLDVLSTSKWVRYDFNNEWYLGGRSHPYAFAFIGPAYEKQIKDYDFHDDFGRFSPVTGDYANAINVFQDRMKQEPNNLEVVIGLAEIFFDLGIAKESVPLLQRALELNPQDHRPYRYLGLINRDTFASEQAALKYLKKYTDLVPRDPFGYHYIAVTYWRIAGATDNLSNYRSAAEYMKKYTDISRDLLYGWKMTGYFYYKAKDYAEAKKWFEKMLKIEPGNEYALRMLNIMKK